MAYPYNFDGREGIDPNDPRYGGSYYPGRIQPSGNYNLYPSELDIEVESPEHQNGQYADHPTHIYSNGQRYPSYEEYASPGSSNPSTDISGMWGTASRNISSRTAPEEDLSPVQAGHRCIFHWIGCEVKASNHDDWVQHIYYGHFDLEERDGKPDKLDFGRAPTSWTCRFRGCGTVVKNDDHRALWDGKLAHIFGHFKNDHGRPEDIQEDLTWLKYYEKMRLCRPVDVYGGVFHPPAQKPFIQGVMTWRKAKDLSRGISHQDAPGEQIRSVPSEQIPHSGYMPSPTQYYPPPEQAYGHHQQMSPGAYQSPHAPNQYHPHVYHGPY